MLECRIDVPSVARFCAGRRSRWLSRMDLTEPRCARRCRWRAPLRLPDASSSLAPLYAALVAEGAEAPARVGEPVLRVEGLNHYYGEGEARNQVLFNNHIEVPAGQLIVMT